MTKVTLELSLINHTAYLQKADRRNCHSLRHTVVQWDWWIGTYTKSGPTNVFTPGKAHSSIRAKIFLSNQMQKKLQNTSSVWCFFCGSQDMNEGTLALHSLYIKLWLLLLPWLPWQPCVPWLPWLPWSGRQKISKNPQIFAKRSPKVLQKYLQISQISRKITINSNSPCPCQPQV